VAISGFTKAIDRNSAKMVVVAQDNKDRRNFTEPGKKTKEMGKTVRKIQKVSSHENPIRGEISNGMKGKVMPWKIAIEVQIAYLNRPSTGKRGILTGNPGKVEG